MSIFYCNDNTGKYSPLQLCRDFYSGMYKPSLSPIFKAGNKAEIPLKNISFKSFELKSKLESFCENTLNWAQIQVLLNAGLKMS